MYFITTKRMLEVCFFQHTPTFIIEPNFITDKKQGPQRLAAAEVLIFMVYIEE